MAAITGLTIEDFEKLPDALAHNRELVKGELVDVSGNTRGHIRVRDFLVSKLLPYVEERNLGEVLSEMEYDFEGNAHGPDLSFVCSAKVPLLDMARRVQLLVPDIAIEIASKNDRLDDILGKLKRYRESGTKQVWLLVISTRQTFFFSDAGDAVLHENEPFRSDLIPGFSIRLKDLFDRA